MLGFVIFKGDIGQQKAKKAGNLHKKMENRPNMANGPVWPGLRAADGRADSDLEN